jgi:hypothetical protein
MTSLKHQMIKIVSETTWIKITLNNFFAKAVKYLCANLIKNLQWKWIFQKVKNVCLLGIITKFKLDREYEVFVVLVSSADNWYFMVN